jgi:PAS domain S-box-containing protein
MAKKKKKPISIFYDGIDRIKTFGLSEKLITDHHFLSFLQQLINDLPLLIIVVDPKDYSIVLANIHFAKSLDVPVERLIGNSIFEFLLLKEIREQRKTYLDRVIQNKKPIKIVDKRDDRYFDGYAYPVLNKDGNLIYVIGIINEITDKKSLEASLADKEQLFSSMIQNSNDFCYLLNKEGTVIYQSPSVRKKLGFEKDSKDRSIFEHIHPEDKDFVKKMFHEVLPKSGKSKMIDFRVLDANKNLLHVEAIANNQLQNKSINGIIINARDISKRVHAQHQLIETVSYLENILNNTKELIFSLTSEGRITIWNDRLVDITGFSAGSMMGKNLFSLSLLDDVDSFKAYLESCIQGVGRPFTFKVISRQGEERFLRVSGSVVRSDDGIEKTVVFTGRDITSEQSGHGKLIWGFSYLITDVDTRVAIELVNGLLDDHDGLIISRDDVSRDLFSDPAGNGRVIQHFFSSDDARDGMVSDPGMLVEDVSSFFSMHDNAFVLIDRLDFLIALYGFKTVMRSIYMVSNLAYRHNGIVLIRLNPSIVSSFELSVLHEELKSLPEENIERITIDKKLFDILEFVYQRDQNQMLTSYKNISTQFSITKVTTAKRISSLSDKGLVVIKKRGRLKTIHVTAKGKNLLQRKKVQ